MEQSLKQFNHSKRLISVIYSIATRGYNYEFESSILEIHSPV